MWRCIPAPNKGEETWTTATPVTRAAAYTPPRQCGSSDDRSSPWHRFTLTDTPPGGTDELHRLHRPILWSSALPPSRPGTTRDPNPTPRHGVRQDRTTPSDIHAAVTLDNDRSSTAMA